ncbi:hypothetical protein [Citricoccus alkalitolerans]|uniref:Uncharacterized protein n=1 Tax=Citricoccus alkalitolerans TaxID=246603 RepID=A0ABV8XUH2_9MICC
MSRHNTEGEHHNESRPQQILREAVDEEGVSDEEAVLAYNANADRQDEAENRGATRED